MLKLLAFAAGLTLAISGHASAQCVNMVAAGADPTGLSDSLPTWVAQNTDPSRCLYFPPGKYSFSAPAVATLLNNQDHLAVLGAGAEVTQLAWSSGDGMQLNTIAGGSPNFNNTFNVRGLSFKTGTSVNSNTGLQLVNNSLYANAGQSVLENLTFRGDDNPVGIHWWGNSLDVFGVSNVTMKGIFTSGHAPDGINFPSNTGNGILLRSGPVAGNVAVGFNMSDLLISYQGNGIVYGASVQGVNIERANIEANYCIFASVQGSGADQLILTKMECSMNNTGVLLNAQIQNVILTDNYFKLGNGDGSNVIGVEIDSPSTVNVSNNTFGLNTTGNASGIVLDGPSTDNHTPSVINGNMFNQLSGFPITLQSNARHVNIQGNSSTGASGLVNNISSFPATINTGSVPTNQ